MPGQGGHVPVMLPEVVSWLRPAAGGVYLDATLGLGGHSLGLLRAAQGRIGVVGLDRDAQALDEAGRRLAEYSGQVRLFHLAFSRFEEALDEAEVKSVDGVVLDLGVSSLQLDSPERGFSFLADGPLDMRMDPSSGVMPARTLLARLGFEELRRIIGEYGEEPLAGKIARAIVRERERAPIEGTARLAEVVALAYPPERRRQARNHPATRTFMALRIAVNREVEEIEGFLARIAARMKAGARIAAISFHSLEDRLVKQAFKREASGCVCPAGQVPCTCARSPRLAILTKKPLGPTDREVMANPRSRSAKLRVAERLGEGGC